ncbi:histidine kinase [Ideonella sp. 4Y11]|uniref:Histidine kinase n=1 Tax=Ideonella aquatica TaxID=2824119 RepID=A0A941BHI8_9BURK|nr:histidine kinase [Ideonella aquatica]MBQ0957687.1 histidine kinase [Ideonella aquatica]
MSTAPDTGHSTLFDDLRDAVEAGVSAAEPASLGPLCRVGMVLRALLVAVSVTAIGLAFSHPRPLDWALAMGSWAPWVVPSTLLWLLLACAAGQLLAQRRPDWVAPLQALAGALAAALVWLVLDQWRLAPRPSTLLAPALAGGALALLMVRTVRWRERARLPATAAAQLADLQTRIRPHFLFNTLNTAIALVQHDPRRAEEVLEDLAELFRATLGTLNRASTLAEEAELARRYLSIEELRFGARLCVRWDLDPNAASARLPTLALQPLVENAVRHGVEPAARGGTIEVRSRRRRDRVLLSVTNTVPVDAPPRPGHGIGLASVRERLRLLHDLDADLHSGIIEDGRWRVSLSLPAE